MASASFQFHAELNDFLPRRSRDKLIRHCFEWRASVKDMIESLGIPHAEIELIIVNGASVDFSYIVQADDCIDVYPCLSAVDITPRQRLRPPHPPQTRFILDTHLGRLAAYLRMLGFDTLYRNDYDDEELALISNREERILLTRDIGLLKRGIVVYGYFMRETNPRPQLAEVMRRYQLAGQITPFKHCMKCNGLLEPVAKEAIIDQLPHDTAQHYTVFHRCQSCRQPYWKGPHYQRMQEILSQVLAAANDHIT